MLIPRRSEVAGEDILGILDGLLRIAAMHALVGQQIALFVDQRRAFRRSFLGIMNGGQNFVVDL